MTTTTTTTPTLNTKWDFQSGTALKDFLFPSESNNPEHTIGKVSIQQRHHRRLNETDRSMVNSSQESDFYGFPSTPVGSVANTNVLLDEKISDIDNEKAHNISYQSELILANDDDTIITTTTLLEQNQLCRKLCGSTSTECGLEQTIASEEYSDQDIRCLNEMTKNEQQIQARVDSIHEDVPFDSESIEPNSSASDDDAAKIVTPTTNYPTHYTLDDDSDNAVDNAISSDRFTDTDLSFNGKLKKLRSSINTNDSKNDVSNTDPNDLTIGSCSGISNKSNLELQLQLETSREHINERSPDLFSEVDDFDHATAHDALDGSAINDSADFKTNDETSAAIWPDKHIEKTERALNKRIQTMLSGIVPPPSITFVQHDITNLLSMYKRNIAHMDLPRISSRNDSKATDTLSENIDKIPTMPNEVEHTVWPEIQRANAYGVHYNRTKYTENIESMYMKLVERYVGQETASSFTFSAPNNTSAAGKKKPIRKLYVIRKQQFNHFHKIQ